MPIRKRAYKKKYVRPNKYGRYVDAGVRALKLATYLKGMINCEKNYFDQALTPTGIDYNGACYHLTSISQGDANGNRAGNSLLARSLYMRLNAEKDSGVTNSSLRIILFKDTSDGSSIPVPSDVLTQTGTTGAYLSPLNKINGSRFKVLRDKTISLSSTRTQADMKEFVKIYQHIKYSGSGGSNIKENQFWLMLISDQLSTTPTVTFYNRTGFYDN